MTPRSVLFGCMMSLLFWCAPARGGVTTDCLWEITCDATHLTVSVARLGKPRPVIFETDSSVEISRIIRSFDLIDPDVAGVPPGEYRVKHCPCVSEYRLEMTLADGSGLTLDVMGDFSIVEASVSLHPQHFGSLSLSDQGKRSVRESLKKLGRRTSVWRQRR